MPKLTQAINGKDHIQGSLHAAVSLVEYGDYQCLVCKMTLPIIKQLQKELGENMCFIFRHFPLKTSHPYAFDAAKAAEAAALQNQFWEMHTLLYANSNELNSNIWSKLAEELHLDVEKFNADFQSPAIEEKIGAIFMGGIRSGVNGTPCFYINGNRFDDDASYDNLKKNLLDSSRES